MVRLSEVAEAVGVSSATVSLVLSGKHNGRVSRDTVERVRQVASELGYIGNAAAMSLRTAQTRILGFISDYIASTPYAVRMVAAANKAALEADRLLMLINTDGSREIERIAVEQFRRHGIDRSVYACMYHKKVDLPDELREGGKVVLLDGVCDSPSVPSIVPDEQQGACDAVQLLIDNGHRNIAYIGEKSDEGLAAGLRLSSYRETLENAGIPIREELIVSVYGNAEAMDSAAFEMLSRYRPTAVFCFNDIRANSVYRAARRLNLSIPRDLSVVGFDNLELISTRMDPPLTTVQLPHAEMGKWAVELLLSDEQEFIPAGGFPVKQYCPLVVRESVSAPPVEAD